MTDSLSLRIDLPLLAAAIALISVSTVLAVVLTRRLSGHREDEDSLSITLGLSLVVAVGLVGLTLLFLGLFR